MESEHSESTKGLKAENESLSDKNAVQQREVERLEKENGEINEKIKDSEKEVEALKKSVEESKVNDLKAEIKSVRDELMQSQDLLKVAQEEASEHKEKFKVLQSGHNELVKDMISEIKTLCEAQ